MSKKDLKKNSMKFMQNHPQLLQIITIYKTFMRIRSNNRITEEHQ
jgi:hypothetical protein